MQCHALALEDGLVVGGGLPRDPGEVEALAAEADLAGGDPADVEEVVHETAEVRDLSAHHVADAVHHA